MRYFLLILLLPILLNARVKLPSATSEALHMFILFNYDNLIADHYEKRTVYHDQLSYLLSQATGHSEDTFEHMLRDVSLATEPLPIKYMLKINRKTSQLTGYYFVDF